MTETRKLRLSCPECDAELVIDAATGEVLFHQKRPGPVAGGKNFEGLFTAMAEQQAEAENTFAREVAAIEDSDRLLEEKFEEALRRAKETPDEPPPPRPFDLD